MGKKNNRPFNSQVLGIVWFSIGLLICIGVAFFSLRRGAAGAETDTILPAASTVLQQKEDSVYASRRQQTVYEPHTRNRTFDTPRRPTPPPATRPVYTTDPPPVRKQPLVVELNSADTLTLQLLNGIGPAYARRIVRYRERLGGFVSTDQLLEVNGFTPELLAHIAPHLRLDTSAIAPLPINSIPLKQLARHPYIEYYQARDIVFLRGKGLLFASADDLRTVPSMADSTLRRLLPYIDFALPADTAAAPQPDTPTGTQ